jgi:hypothetical protein
MLLTLKLPYMFNPIGALEPGPAVVPQVVDVVRQRINLGQNVVERFARVIKLMDDGSIEALVIYGRGELKRHAFGSFISWAT